MARGWWCLIGALWAASVIAGFGVLLRYKSTAGPTVRGVVEWPSSSRLPHQADRPTLVMFVHPRCPCSRASITEFRKLLQRVRGRATASIVFVEPKGVDAAWGATDLRATAAGIPGAALFVDEGSVEADRFGAGTSGTCMLYDARGQLQFAGGITALRGHEGDSLGQERIVALLTGGVADRPDSPVFGCSFAENPSASSTRRNAE